MHYLFVGVFSTYVSIYIIACIYQAKAYLGVYPTIITKA